ncbi:MAG: glycosyltransferase [Alphaproteobacteria bacterium]|nr:glycosyltransferase [Alphaproteobacteria bacterium]
MNATPETQAASPSADTRAPRIAIVVHRLGGGGDQRTAIILANALAQRGFAVDLLSSRVLEKSAQRVRPGVRLLTLPESGWIASRLLALRADWAGIGANFRALASAEKVLPGFRMMPAIAGYFREWRPDAIYAVGPIMGLACLFARRLSQTAGRLVMSERVAWGGWEDREVRAGRIVRAVRRAYLAADHVVSVSAGLADDIARRLDIPRERIAVTYNPVNLPVLGAMAAEEVEHPWFLDRSVPLILGVGRLSKQKDFATLVRAIAEVRRTRRVRLALIGDADRTGKDRKERARLLDLAGELGLGDDLTLIGFQSNPYRFMARASMLVSSSRMEGLSNVVLESLACGTPVVGTDCPFGTAEILGGGSYGRLVPVGDHPAMAEAILATLDNPPSPATLIARARQFDFEDWVANKTAELTGGTAASRPKAA